MVAGSHILGVHPLLLLLLLLLVLVLRSMHICHWVSLGRATIIYHLSSSIIYRVTALCIRCDHLLDMTSIYSRDTLYVAAKPVAESHVMS